MHETKVETGAMMFVRGVILGAVLTALLTPRKGEDMRDGIKRKINDVTSKAKDTATDVGQKVEDKADEIKETIHKRTEKNSDSRTML